MIVSIHNLLFSLCQCQMLNISLLCKYVDHIGQ